MIADDIKRHFMLSFERNQYIDDMLVAYESFDGISVASL